MKAQRQMAKPDLDAHRRESRIRYEILIKRMEEEKTAGIAEIQRIGYIPDDFLRGRR